MVRSKLFGFVLKDALFVDPYAKALSGQDGLAMSDRLGEAACQFGFDNWPEFHKVLHGSLFFFFFPPTLRKFHGKCFDFADCQSMFGWPPLLNGQVWTVVRTKFIDDVLSAVRGVQQMVNLGAGVDTRPYRLDIYKEFKASFEVDTTEVPAA